MRSITSILCFNAAVDKSQVLVFVKRISCPKRRDYILSIEDIMSINSCIALSKPGKKSGMAVVYFTTSPVILILRVILMSEAFSGAVDSIVCSGNVAVYENTCGICRGSVPLLVADGSGRV